VGRAAFGLGAGWCDGCPPRLWARRTTSWVWCAPAPPLIERSRTSLTSVCQLSSSSAATSPGVTHSSGSKPCSRAAAASRMSWCTISRVPPGATAEISARSAARSAVMRRAGYWAETRSKPPAGNSASSSPLSTQVMSTFSLSAWARARWTAICEMSSAVTVMTLGESAQTCSVKVPTCER